MRYAPCSPLNMTINKAREIKMPVMPRNVITEIVRLLRILIVEKAISVIKDVSNAGKGLLRLQKASEKNKPESNNAINTTIYFRLLSAKMKNKPSDKNEAITYKTTLAANTAFSALSKAALRCSIRR